MATWRSIEAGEDRKRRPTTWRSVEETLGLADDTPVARAERAIEYIVGSYAAADADPFFEILRPHLDEDVLTDVAWRLIAMLLSRGVPLREVVQVALVKSFWSLPLDAQQEVLHQAEQRQEPGRHTEP